MAALKTMADRRLQNILSHLSPPVSSNSSESPQRSGCSASESGHVGERNGNLGALEDGTLCQETKFQPGKLLKLECRGPNTDREAKLIENLMLSRLRRFHTQGKCNASGSQSEIRLVPCTSEHKSQEMAEEHVQVNLETRELETPETSRESEGGTVHGLSDDEGEFIKQAEAVRSGITSASAVSSSRAASFNEGLSPTNLNSKPRGQLSPSRVAACEFCDIIQGIAPCFKVCTRAPRFCRPV